MNVLVKSICCLILIGSFLYCGGKAQRVMVCDIPQIDLKVEQGRFSARSEPSVYGKEGWILLKEKRVH